MSRKIKVKSGTYLYAVRDRVSGQYHQRRKGGDEEAWGPEPSYFDGIGPAKAAIKLMVDNPSYVPSLKCPKRIEGIALRYYQEAALERLEVVTFEVVPSAEPTQRPLVKSANRYRLELKYKARGDRKLPPMFPAEGHDVYQILVPVKGRFLGADHDGLYGCQLNTANCWHYEWDQRRLLQQGRSTGVGAKQTFNLRDFR